MMVELKGFLRLLVSSIVLKVSLWASSGWHNLGAEILVITFFINIGEKDEWNEDPLEVQRFIVKCDLQSFLTHRV